MTEDTGRKAFGEFEPDEPTAKAVTGGNGNGHGTPPEETEDIRVTTDFTPSIPPTPVQARREQAETEVVEGGGKLIRFWRLALSGVSVKGIKGGYGAMPLIILTFLAVIELFDDAAFGLVIPEIQTHFRLNLTTLLTVFTYIGVVGLLASGPIGYLGDRKKRTTISGIGGIIASLGALGTAIAPTKNFLIFARSLGTQGSLATSSVQFGLLSDYYPLEERPRAFAFRSMGRNLGSIAAPLFVGVVGTALAWQAPFLMVGTIGILLSISVFFLKEPVRGYHERVAYGADAETAAREQEPPSWAEAWRAAWGVRTVRRISFTIPFSVVAERGLSIFFPLYFQRVFGLSLLERGYIAAASAGAGIIGLLLGGPLMGKILGRNPGRVVILTGLVSLGGAFAIAGMALTANLAVALTLNLVFGFVAALLLPARISVFSSVIPPRLRNLGLSVLAYWELIPFIIGLPFVGFLADQYGIRAGILFLTPLLMISAIIYMTAGPFVEFDIRSANAAAMASETWRKSKAEGKAKMLVIRDLDVHYETVQVLFGVDLDVQEGEILALLGTNGAGKSTLLRAISGTQQASGGAIVFDGRDVTRVPPNEIVRHGIVHMPGGRGVFPGLTVRENFSLAGWVYGDDPEHGSEVDQVLGYFPVLKAKMDQLAGTLSGGEQQMLALGQAFLSRPRLLMIDELSLGLAPSIVEQLLGIIRAIHERGTTIILVEQSVNVALTVAERAVFMEKGEVRFDGPTAELLNRPDILRAVFLKGGGKQSKSLREVAGSEQSVTNVQVRRAALAEAPPILEVENLTKRYGGVTAVDGVTFALREGEILGFIGPNGAGKTTVMEMVSGFNLPDEGRVIYEGADITFMPPEQRSLLRLTRRFQDARLFPSLTVSEVIAVAFERHYDLRSAFLEGLQLPQARVQEQRIRKRVDLLVELLELEGYRDKFISELSTGTRRVVDLACVLATDPKVLLLDEPSSGMAQREAENLVPLLLRVRQETGCSMMVVEHDIPLISMLADELIAMDLGKVVVRGTPKEVLENEHVVRAYLGTSEEVINRSGSGAPVQ